MALALCCLALAALIYLQLDQDLSARPASAPRPMARAVDVRQETAIPPADAFDPAPIAAYDEIVERPLFHRTRRPIAAKDEPRDGAGGARLPIRLVGIVVDAEGRSAFLKLANAPRAVRVTYGGIVDGWTVEAIDHESVTLMKKGMKERLSTKDARLAPGGESEARQAKVTRTTGKQEGPRRKQHENRD
jgi:hypothetical protein